MSRSTPVCSLKCSKCHAKAPLNQRYGDAPRSWRNVAVIGPAMWRGVPRVGTALCECKTCGHRYVSSSRAALRQLGRIQRSSSSVGRGPENHLAAPGKPEETFPPALPQITGGQGFRMKRAAPHNHGSGQKGLSPQTVEIVGEAITEAVCVRFMEWNSGRKGIKAPLGLKAEVYAEVANILENGVLV